MTQIRTSLHGRQFGFGPNNEMLVRDPVTNENLHLLRSADVDMSLSRPRYARRAKPSSSHVEGAVGASGHRHGHRSRSLLGSFGRIEIEVPRARLNTPDGKTTEWESTALRAYQRRTLVADGQPERRLRRLPCAARRSLRLGRYRWHSTGCACARYARPSTDTMTGLAKFFPRVGLGPCDTGGGGV